MQPLLVLAGEILDGQRQADQRAELIDVAVSVDARMCLGHAAHVAEVRLTAIAEPGVDPRQVHRENIYKLPLVSLWYRLDMSVIEPGTPAPESTLKREDGSDFTHADLLGHTTVLVFYPNAFSPVCTDQLQLYEDHLDDFRAQGAVLYGVSCDQTWSQTAFREKLGVTIEQLSDFEPKGAASRAFGAYFEPAGFSNRALVIVGPDGIVRWSHQADSPGDLPRAELLFDGLAATRG